ncbi:hypothetical protein SAY87_025347 [Trapa incisa]|uniref:Transducin/WD40 repeat-like superfamily protein n=1 Tax=Trapa incisa TaxID=236973 RepID=A0AAN7JFQ4_9MYRT|nr:hypothetical protein SAY87_025347 [Trapa incisa]
MPRTTTVESSGCPPIRALTFDVLGLIKVVEARVDNRLAKMVDRWGEPDSSRCILAASLNDRKSNPLLAIARKCCAIEILNPLNGNVFAEIADAANDGQKPEDDPVVGLHLFKNGGTDGSCTVLTCTTKGNACMRSFTVSNSLKDSTSDCSTISWKVFGAGNILCSKVDTSETHAVFGGKGVEVNIWDLQKCTKIWTAKSPPKNSLGIFTPSWFTSATFLCEDDHRKVVAGTNCHQVRLYDASAQRRPVISIDFRETAIKAVSEDLDGYTIYAGNSSGDLASFDIRTGKMLGSFMGQCSGSIRSIDRHPNFPVIASCGIDSYLRIWDIKSRQLLSAVYLKQSLNSVLFDSNFSGEGWFIYICVLCHATILIWDNQKAQLFSFT